MRTYGINISEAKAYGHTIRIQTDKDFNFIGSVLDEIRANNSSMNINNIKEALVKKGITIKNINLDRKGDSIDYSFDELEELE